MDMGIDSDAEIVVKVTDEGVIIDLEAKGEVMKTWGSTAQEMADDLVH